MGSSRGFGSLPSKERSEDHSPHLNRPLQTRFRWGTGPEDLRLPEERTRRLILQ